SGGSSGWTDGCSKFDSSGFALAGYKPDGSLDPTFGDGGITQTSEPGVGVALAVQPDGEVVAAEGNHLDRYAPNGSLNLSFDPDPTVRHFGALALQDGNIVVAGAHPTKGPSVWPLAVARYKSSGQLDPKFGTHGYTEIKQVVGLPDSVLNQKDGKLLIASGPRTDQGPPAVVRLLRNGRLDSHF